MVLLTTLVQIIITLILFCSTGECRIGYSFNNYPDYKSKEGATYKRNDSKRVSKEYILKYLTPEKCNRSDRTRTICKLLSNSKKYQTIGKYITTSSSRTPSYISKRIGFLDSYEEDGPESKLFIDRDFNNFVDTDGYDYPEDIPMWKIHKFPSLTKQNRKFPHLRIPRSRQLRSFKMKKFRSIWPKKILNARNKLAEMPLALPGIPLIWTLGIALILKHQLKQGHMMMTIPQNLTLDSERGTKNKAENNSSSTKEKFQLTKEVVSLTAESLNLAANKIDFVNVLAKTLQPKHIESFLSTQRLNMNSTLLNTVKNFRGNGESLTNLVGEFVRVIAEQAVRNATNSITGG